MPYLVCACDSFKGSLSSLELAELIKAEARQAFPTSSFVGIAMADGGEGTLDAVLARTCGKKIAAEVSDPLGRPITAHYGLLDDGSALIEAAAASGLPLLAPDERNPLVAMSYGTGQLIAQALDQGATSITIALGGTATNDGGMGLLRALGVSFVDKNGEELQGIGADLCRVEHMSLARLNPRIPTIRFQILCDVTNPLTGPQGATAVFGPQKGVTSEMVPTLDRGMSAYARLLEAQSGVALTTTAGMGAAGGMAAACCAVLKAEVCSGVEWVIQKTGLIDELSRADLCITGEGHADAQSACGKVISGVARACQTAGVPCIALVGGMDEKAEKLLELGVSALIPCVRDICTHKEALSRASYNVSSAARQAFSLMNLGVQAGVHTS